MPNSPRKTQVVKCSGFKNGSIFRDNRLGDSKKNGKHFSTRQFFTTSDEIFLTGYIQTNLENPSNTTNMAIFPFRLLTMGPTKSIKIRSRDFVTISLLWRPTLESWAGLAL
jgi:hypothetical protein